MNVMEYLIVGGGAQVKYAIDLLLNCYNQEILGILDVENNQEYHGSKIGGIEVLGYYKELIEAYEGVGVVVCHSDNKIKERIYLELKESNYKFPNLVHPNTYLSEYAELGEGNIINSYVSVMPFVSIGNCTVIHSNSVIEHDCKVDDFVNIAPSATLAGYVKVGKRSYIFTNSAILPGVEIGKDASVGAGAVVLEDVPDGSTVKGVPAR